MFRADPASMDLLAALLGAGADRARSPQLESGFVDVVDRGFDWAGAISRHPFDKVSVVSAGGTRALRRQQVTDVGFLLDSFHDGATVILDEFDRLDAGLYRWVAALEQRVRRSVHVNCYISPPASTGLPPHTDGYDVAVLQLLGEKYWTFGGHHPGPSQQVADQDFKASIAARMRLGEGDLVVVPAGIAHQANTGSSSSIHLTFGFHDFDAADLSAVLKHAAAGMRDDLAGYRPAAAQSGTPDIGDLLDSPRFRAAVAKSMTAVWPSKRTIVPESLNSVLQNRRDDTLATFRGEWVAGHEGQAMVFDDLLSPRCAETLLHRFEGLPMSASDLSDGRHNRQTSLTSPELAALVEDGLRAALSGTTQSDDVGIAVGPCLQLFDYEAGEFVGPHCDASKQIGHGRHSTHTLIHYLEADCLGGGTIFHDPDVVCEPRKGRTVIFATDHVRHSGQMLFSGRKRILRCDIHLSASGSGD